MKKKKNNDLKITKSYKSLQITKVFFIKLKDEIKKKKEIRKTL